MTLLVPLFLFAVFLLTGLLCNAPGITFSSRYNRYTIESLRLIAGLYLNEWHDIKPEFVPNVVYARPRKVHTPIRLKLYWESNSIAVIPTMAETEEPAPSSRALKRFSIQLPSAPKDHVRSSSVESSRPASPQKMEVLEPGNFLVALAAQERRVLELKEELSKAETDLLKLKRQWAHHEAIRKRQEIRQQAEPMRAMKSPIDDSAAQEMKSARELAKRRSVVTRAKPTRKVFEGRHARALSLLSPTSLVHRGGISDTVGKQNDIVSAPATALPRAPLQENVKNSSESKEDIVSTSKQIMGDLKEGLWTFLEDLKQATVGDEAISPARPRHVDAKVVSVNTRTAPETRDLIDFNPKAVSPRLPTNQIEGNVDSKKAFSSEHGAVEPGNEVQAKDMSDDDGWDNWDSPPPKDSASTFSSTTRSTPRSSLSSDIKRQSATFEQIPWPALQKLTPGNLTRTASNLMKEWEKSLNSPTEEALSSVVPDIDSQKTVT